MRILITGGAGFIGTNTALYFIKKGHEVIIVDNFSRTGVEDNAAYLKQKGHNKIKFIKQDVLDVDHYLDDLKSCDVIIHLAGQTAVTTSIQKPSFDFKNNLQTGFTLLETIRQHNPESVVIYASTNKVYGDLAHHKVAKDENLKQYKNIDHPQGITETECLQFISPYGCSKGGVDQYFLDYARIYELKTVVFRQSCIYGAFQMGVEDQGWVAFFAKQILQQKSFHIFGDGYQVRDLLFVQDLIRAYELAIQNIHQVKGQVFNIGGGVENAYSLLNVITKLEKKIGYKANYDFEKTRSGDQLYFVSDNTKLDKLLNWKVMTNLDSGLEVMLNWQNQYFA